jgi:hypothetical protein
MEAIAPCHPSGVHCDSFPFPSLQNHKTHFLRIPKNILSFDVSSGGLSAGVTAPTDEDSEAVDGAVEAGESSKEPEDVDAMVI